MASKYPDYDGEAVYDGEVYSAHYDIPEYVQAAAPAATSDCDEEEPAFTFAAAAYDDYRGYRPEDDPVNTYVATVDSKEDYGYYNAVAENVEAPVYENVETIHVPYEETADCVSSQ